jgi:hypothetical protein
LYRKIREFGFTRPRRSGEGEASAILADEPDSPEAGSSTAS